MPEARRAPQGTSGRLDTERTIGDRSGFACGQGAVAVVGNAGGTGNGGRRRVWCCTLTSSPEEAERCRFHAHGDPFEPELWSDRVAIGLSREVIEFLAAAGFSFDPHIDAALDDEAAP